MTDKKNHIEDRLYELNGDVINYYFFLLVNTKRYRSYSEYIKRKPLQFYLDKFNIDDYIVYKSTGKQRIVDIKKENYSGYIFFIKSKYKKENIDIWIDFFNGFGGIQYLSKPLPPFDPNKIIIKK